jgi:hypothetical protein
VLKSRLQSLPARKQQISFTINELGKKPLLHTTEQNKNQLVNQSINRTKACPVSQSNTITRLSLCLQRIIDFYSKVVEI